MSACGLRRTRPRAWSVHTGIALASALAWLWTSNSETSSTGVRSRMLIVTRPCSGSARACSNVTSSSTVRSCSNTTWAAASAISSKPVPGKIATGCTRWSDRYATASPPIWPVSCVPVGDPSVAGSADARQWAAFRPRPWLRSTQNRVCSNA